MSLSENKEINTKSNSPKINTNDSIMELQLGDVIKIIDPSNETNEKSFLIEYIDEFKIKLINVDDFQKVTLKIRGGVIENGTITSIFLLYRNPEKGYARQNELLMNKWITITFDYNVPLLVTAEITNLEEDMIELKTFPAGETIYINFDYKGIPEDLPIESIIIREKPESQELDESKNANLSNGSWGTSEEPEKAEPEEPEKAEPEEAEKAEPEEPEKAEKAEPEKPQAETDKGEEPKKTEPEIRNQIRETILKADDIQFGDEEFGPVYQYVDVNVTEQRYSIESQTNDLLNDLLSTIPTAKRTDSVLTNIHTIIERFKQLRDYFSLFDDRGNLSPRLNKASIKPLIQYFQSFDKPLLWILPVVKNIKKMYIDKDEDAENIMDIKNQTRDLNEVMTIINDYKNKNQENKYSNLYTELNPYFTPFDYPNEEMKQTIGEFPVAEQLNVVINNLGDLNTYTVNRNLEYSKRFLMEKYNTGLSKLNATNFSGNQMSVTREDLTNPDVMYIQSFITLPEPIIRFSRIYLPGTSLFEKANLNNVFPRFWQFLKEKTDVEEITIQDVETSYPYTENTFANNIKHFSLDATDLSKKELYDKFVESIIPTIKILFQFMKKYMKKVSIVSIVEYLEPFLIYTDNLTYMQFVEITQHIDAVISEYNKTYSKNSQYFSQFKRKTPYSSLKKDVFSLLELLEDKDELMKDYELQEKNEFVSDSETLRKIILKDNAKLYTTILAYQNMKLMYPDEFTTVFDNQKFKIGKSIDDMNNAASECKNIIISKFYTSEEELHSDNEKEIYFDKKYDKTNYGFLDEYQNELIAMESDKFIDFLISKINKKLKVFDKEAEQLADTLITGYKKVEEGDYAILYKYYENRDTNEDEYTYYVRKNNKWELDPSINEKDIKTDDPNILCNIQPSCISVPDKIKDKCESIKQNELQLENKNIDDVLNEFDKKYQLSFDQFKEKMETKMGRFQAVFESLTHLENNEFLKNNNKMYELGNSVIDSTRVVSPYAKLCELILGDPDFIKKQMNIIEFVKRFTRKAIDSLQASGEKESPYWLYCTATNVQLIPAFYYHLASVYINTPESYNEEVEKLIKTSGKQSEDGDYWVDEHTGRKIKYIGFSTEEGYEGGFKTSTRDVLEEDAGKNIGNDNDKYKSPEMIMIRNIIDVLSVSIGINIESQKDFMMGTVLEYTKLHLENEKNYKKRVEEMANKNKQMPSYKEYYNTIILYFTLGVYLIGIQTSIPSVKSKKTFPGCVKSFTGYPFEGAGDMSSLNYLACVANKIKSIADPWNVLARKKLELITSKIKSAIDTLLELSIVKSKIDEKTLYLLTQTENEIPEEHNVLKWHQFLPPLSPFKITGLVNISSEFKSGLNNDLTNGSPSQIEKISVLQSKNIQFSLAIQEKIQDVVTKKHLLLSTSSGVPYLENACCNEKSELSTLAYFENENNNITAFNKIVNDNSNTLTDIMFYAKAITLASNKNTKRVFPSVNTKFDEKTIYYAFIHFCHFKNLIPIKENLLPLCNEKPGYINKNDTLIEMIQKLKNDKKEYTEQMMLRLLQLVSRTVNVRVDTPKSNIVRFKDVLEYCKKDNVDDGLLNKIIRVLDTFDIASEIMTEDTKNLINYLITHTTEMKEQIIDFITRNVNAQTNKRLFETAKQFIHDLSDWKTTRKSQDISDDSLYNSIQFYKTNIENLVNVFPNIILNKINYSSVKIPNYWNLSSKHQDDIKDIIGKNYECFKPFYDKELNLDLNDTFSKIQSSCKNYVFLAKETPSFTSIKYKEKELKPIFDERTSRLLFEYYLLKILVRYIDLTDDTQKTAMTQLLLCFINILSNSKNMIDISHQQIEDNVFKLKQREKNMITDRLEKKTDEERNVDTMLKTNKLGDWSKGLQKGLRTYDKDHYDKESDFVKTMKQYEKAIGKKVSMTREEFEENQDDIRANVQENEDIEKDAYSMNGMTDDYENNGFNGVDDVEVDDFDDYE